LLIVWKTVYRWVTGKAWDVAPEGTETEWAAAVEVSHDTAGPRSPCRFCLGSVFIHSCALCAVSHSLSTPRNTMLIHTSPHHLQAAAANVGEREQSEHEHEAVHPSAASGDGELRQRVAGADHKAVRTVETVQKWVDTLAKSKVHGTAVVVKFTATWCKPCQRIAPLYAELASSTPTAEFVEVDVDKCQDVAKGAGSPFTLPTFQVYRGSVRVASMSGSAEDALKKLVADSAQ
jgi:thiol-disulfide isomerase/thioredoxin